MRSHMRATVGSTDLYTFGVGGGGGGYGRKIILTNFYFILYIQNWDMYVVLLPHTQLIYHNLSITSLYFDMNDWCAPKHGRYVLGTRSLECLEVREHSFFDDGEVSRALCTCELSTGRECR